VIAVYGVVIVGAAIGARAAAGMTGRIDYFRSSSG
jgi:hypothetical protein